MTKQIMTFAAICLLSASLSVKAGDLTVDNLTLYGKLEFANETVYPASGGTITTYSNYVIHTFTTVGTNSFIVSSGSMTCDVLIVAGGGAGGCANHGGGGGAGGLIFTNLFVSGTNVVIVGLGGDKSTSSDATNGMGGNSVFASIIAYGGGRGGSARFNNLGISTPPRDGGSGGGSWYMENTPGSGINGQGNTGGYGSGDGGNYGGGGGGGAGAVGENGTGSNGGNGGVGLAYVISGATNYYAGGGGGSTYNGGTPGEGGLGGGGAGSSEVGADAVSNTGGGGGGGERSGGWNPGGSGGSGIVIVRYPMPTNITETASIYGIKQNSGSATNIFLGKVGIGTNSPAEKMHVAGNIKVDGMVIMTAPAGGLPMGVFTNQ